MAAQKVRAVVYLDPAERAKLLDVAPVLWPGVDVSKTGVSAVLREAGRQLLERLETRLYSPQALAADPAAEDQEGGQE